MAGTRQSILPSLSASVGLKKETVSDLQWEKGTSFPELFGKAVQFSANVAKENRVLFVDWSGVHSLGTWTDGRGVFPACLALVR